MNVICEHNFDVLFWLWLVFIYILSLFLCSTILEEEKVQQEERFRMEVRRQVTVSWDSGNSDEAPPKVRHHWTNTTQTHHTRVTRIIHLFINTHSFCELRLWVFKTLDWSDLWCWCHFHSPADLVTRALVPVMDITPVHSISTTITRYWHKIPQNKHIYLSDVFF